MHCAEAVSKKKQGWGPLGQGLMSWHQSHRFKAGPAWDLFLLLILPLQNDSCKTIPESSHIKGSDGLEATHLRVSRAQIRQSTDVKM